MKKIAELKKEGRYTEERDLQITTAMPARYKNADVEKANKGQEAITKWALGKKKKKSLYIWGGVGSGKTYMAYALYKLLRANGWNTLIGGSIDILQDIKEDFTNKAKDPYYQSKFDKWIEHPGPMIIDDLGAEKLSDWVLETFYSLINTRYERELPTIFTSNYSLKQLSERVGDRITSRIFEMCEIIKLDGDDRRIGK